MKERIKAIIARSLDLPVADITDDASPQTLPKWDSLKHMNIIMNLEEEFGVRFAETELLELTDLEKIARSIQTHA